MLSAEEIRDYFYAETRDLAIESIGLVETKNSYFDTIGCCTIFLTCSGVTLYLAYKSIGE